MTLLAHAFMARDILREAFDIRVATLISSARDTSVIILSTPLRPRRGHTHSLNFVIYEDPVTGDIKTTAGIHPSHDNDVYRTFKLRRNNLLGYLGLESIPLLQRPNATACGNDQITNWLYEKLRASLQFDWQEQSNKVVFISGPLHPKSENEDDALRNPNPYPRMKVFKDGRFKGDREWTHALVAPNGRDLNVHGPMCITGSQAQLDAERAAIKNGHWPAGEAFRVVQWQFQWAAAIDDTTDDSYTYKALLSTSDNVEIAHQDEVIVVTRRTHRNAEHGGSAFFSKEEQDQAFDHALQLIEHARTEAEKIYR